ncbi:tyrosyl-DNA phosphodiesterase Tdp1 [Schizosaccharomyces japonicus yFS275]|uniref:Tyrosyl-DNA phosphodiesterase Tdp1 n=1 Tax=Schizosaccharomyces japonicus (strain yFS275 / FY16936) TaxID=402676 RepID=B6K6S9_SCHJY|nr:tyrosyl-DNA phosphodiesterase Tdp1 [Schizosaccharomyces japonicus yFS275]EEB09233.1 tyrosyl-DNA phosphodiesterase Tdp1 [Schizosaccharomyces japonicus yFS275]
MRRRAGPSASHARPRAETLIRHLNVEQTTRDMSSPTDSRKVKKRKLSIETCEKQDSPIFLNSIKSLPDEENVHCLSLRQLIGSKNLRETWQFNFCIDLGFIVENMHPSVLKQVKVHVTHGYSYDSPRMDVLRQQKTRLPMDIELHSVYVPQWGTHHSKIMVNFFADDSCQVVIHTANMIQMDWEGMSQAIYKTPLLWRKTVEREGPPSVGDRFQKDFCSYLSHYKHCAKLICKLQRYDFTSVKAIFISSVPGKFGGDKLDSWGHNRLEKELAAIESMAEFMGPRNKFQDSDICVSQCSSMGSFGARQAFLKEHTKALHCDLTHWKLIFPTVTDVRDSLLGWHSGSSIHFNVTARGAPAQVEELVRHNQLCKWKAMKSGRQRIAPHVKTYMRLNDEGTLIRWVLLTSANLSKPAWGTLEGVAANSKTEHGLRIRSYEAGVLLHPGLFADDSNSACAFFPVYKSNSLKSPNFDFPLSVAIRMPWDFPPQPYGDKDDIWSPSIPRNETDWLGSKWPPTDYS